MTQENPERKNPKNQTKNQKKTYFQTRTTAEIKQLDELIEDEARATTKSRPAIAWTIESLNTNEYYVVQHASLIPSHYKDATRYKKHGNRYHLDDHVMNIASGLKHRIDPLGERPGSGIEWSLYSGYSYDGIGRDQRTTIVPLAELCKAARLYAYHKQPGIKDAVDPDQVFDDAANTYQQGANAVVNIASRRKKQSRHEFSIRGIPVVENMHAKKLWRGIRATGDTTRASHYRHHRFGRPESKESNERYFALAPEIAAYWLLCDHYWNKHHNKTPHTNSPYLVPTHDMLAFYEKLENNVLVEEHKGTHRRQRTLNDAEKEILLWGWVKRVGYDVAFKQNGKKLREYTWLGTKKKNRMNK